MDGWNRKPVSGEGLSTAESPSPDRLDVAELIGQDHEEVESLIRQLEQIPSASMGGSEEDASRRESILDMVVERLVGHEAAEEAYFWPAVRSWLQAEGIVMAERATSEEEKVNNLLLELHHEQGASEDSEGLIEQLSGLIRAHVAFEEQVLLQVREKVDIELRIVAGRDFAGFKERAPTRPHHGIGSAPARPFGILATVDKVRDGLGGRPAKRQGQPEDGEERTSDA